jgi:predicted Zn-dependent protease with MMP-like domain
MKRDDIFVSDMDFDHFDEIFRQELSRIPDKFREGVSQFIIEEKEYRYSKYMPGLYTLGHYMPRGYLGHPVVILYFGYFKRAFNHSKPSELEKEVAKTLAHELLHHWELKSGYDKLGEEDQKSLEEYRLKTGYKKNSPSVGRNLSEIALYIYLVFILIAVVARWIGLNF